MSECLPFERIKRIDTKHSYTVSGYIRNIRTPHIPESVQLIILLFYYNTIDSSILTDDECDKLLSLFEKENVFKTLGNYSYKLLFRGTRDGFEAETFYAKCDDKKNTICIIHTPQNNVFGGYTSIPWNRKEDDFGYYSSDPSAFIFSIRWKESGSSNPEVFPVTNEGKSAVSNDKNYFLTFGNNGNGFYCWQPTNTEITVYASTFRCIQYNLDKYQLNGENYSFKPTEIEVFQLEHY